MQDTTLSVFEGRSSAELLPVVEAALDARYHRLELPHQNLTIALWYLLTVFEDCLRGMFSLSGDDDRASVVLQLDRLKYAARFAMDRVREECVDRSLATLPTKVSPPVYTRTLELLYGGVDYMSANQLCSAAHAGSVTFLETPTAVEAHIDERIDDRRYAALELMGHGAEQVIDHATLLYAWMRDEQSWPPVLKAVADSARVVGTRVRYQYRLDMAVGLAQSMMQPPALIPEGWKFPWGGRHETTLLINALAVRCLYHLVAVHFGAVQHGLRGGGEASILLILTKQELLRDLRAMSSLPVDAIRRFVELLTFGWQTRTPDPALQPLIGIGRDQVAIPCLMVLSGNPERNLLTLQARLDPKKFHAMSKLFEDSMVTEFMGELSPRWPHLKANAMIKLDDHREEIDLLIADRASRTLLIGELRWMLQPGEAREVQLRQKACLDKVSQLRRKVDWVRRNADAVLKRVFGIDAAGSGWQVDGIVVIKTFAGAPSPDAELPIMTSKLFLLGMGTTASLAQFAAWSQSLTWLPKEGRDFTVGPAIESLPGMGKDVVGLTFELSTTPSAYYTRAIQALLDLAPIQPAAS